MMKTKSKTASAKAKGKPLRKPARRTAGASSQAAAKRAPAKAKRAAKAPANRAAKAPAKRGVAEAKRAAKAPANRAAKAPPKRAPAEAKRAAKAPAKRGVAATPELPSRNRAVSAAKRTDDADAFIRDPGEGPARTRDELAEALGEDFIEAATSGNEVLDEDLDRTLPEELGGPFVVTRAGEELADDVDASNPLDAQREPIPTAVSGLVRPSLDDDGEEDAEEDRA